MVKNLSQGTGRRKTSVARAYLRQGAGKIDVNGKDVTDYFRAEELEAQLRRPLDVTDSLKKFDLVVRVRGGGLSGQAAACLHAISRALVAYEEGNKTPLRENGFLTRDARMVERKKYGRRGARRKYQFSKR